LITKEEAAASPMKNILTRALGVKPDADADLDELILFDGDRLLLCTDGLHTMVTDDAIMHTVLSSDHPAAACAALIDAANTAGGKDNVTAVLGRVQQTRWYSFLFKILESLRR
jgi:serine/threonine protein phosphatase PrpC